LSDTVTIPRRSFNKREHLAQYVAQNGKCNCGQCDGLMLRPGEIHEQHDPPYYMMKNTPGYDGKPKWLWTKECHENITREVDGPAIVKARHMGGGKGSQQARRKNKSYRPLKGGRGFDKRFKKKLDGTVEERME
jgi:hypothetical protein